MKTTFYKFSTAIIAFSVALTSCTKDFTEVNTDPNNTPHTLPQQLLAPALASTLNYNLLRNRNVNNELMQVTVDMGDGQGEIFRYDIRDNVSDYLYNGWFTDLTNYKDLYKTASDSLTLNTSYMGISQICQAWVYSMLTDTYGDVPYFHSNEGRDSLNFTPAFDKQKDIYTDIFKRLDAADTLLKKGTAIVPNSDPIYSGDVTKWRKLGNSLYLRLLLRISGKQDVATDCIKKIQSRISDTVNYPIITSNAESAILKWTGGALVSPYVSVRAQDFRAPAICSFFIDHLSAWSSPFIDIPTYGTNGVCRWGIAPAAGNFIGVPSGYSPGTGAPKGAYFYATDQTVNSAVPLTLQTDPNTGIIMTYSELNFIMAECIAKGWISGKAGDYYNAGIQNCITQWIPTWTRKITDYTSAADITWDDASTLDAKMEMIHLQKYYALFLTDMEQWFEYRRTGHPVLPKGTGLQNGGVMPARLKYPVYIQSTNPTNYKAAVASQGADAISTQVWWQKP
jgi:hypothetical protein